MQFVKSNELWSTVPKFGLQLLFLVMYIFNQEFWGCCCTVIHKTSLPKTKMYILVIYTYITYICCFLFMNVPFCVFACSLHFAVHLRPTWPKKQNPTDKKSNPGHIRPGIFLWCGNSNPSNTTPFESEFSDGTNLLWKIPSSQGRNARLDSTGPHGWFIYIYIHIFPSVNAF